MNGRRPEDESGATTFEYAIMLAIMLVALGALMLALIADARALTPSDADAPEGAAAVCLVGPSEVSPAPGPGCPESG